MALTKLTCVLSSAGAVLLLAWAGYAGMDGLARQVESSNDVYPWREEDYLRFLEGSLMDGEGSSRIFLGGPSEAREDFIFQKFEEAFPGMEAYQAGQSLGTFDDLLLALEYGEAVWGHESAPAVLVMGITPRFVGSILSDGRKPLAASITRYSPYFTVDTTSAVPRLVEKPFLDGLRSRIRFIGKQRERFRAAIAGVVNAVVDDGTPYERYLDDFPAIQAGIPSFVRSEGLQTSMSRLTRLYVSPYRYHHLEPWPVSRIQRWSSETDSFWYLTHHWNPTSDSALVQARFDRLNAYLERCGTRLYVVNLPEHPLIQRGYLPGYYEAYLGLVRSAVPDSTFLDLRTMMRAEDFYDAGHLTLESALRVSERTIAFLKNHEPVSTADALAAVGLPSP